LFLIKRVYNFCYDILNNSSFIHSYIFFNDFNNLERKVNQINTLKNAKVAIIYYDFLFYNDVSLALSICNIKTVSTQERGSLLAVFPRFMNFDYYYIWGKEFEKLIEKYTMSKINNYIISGYPRTDFTVTGNNYYKKYEDIQKQKFLILALDYHSSAGSILNDVNKQFYNLLIKIAAKFPECYIIIKGKNTFFMNLDEFSDIVKKMGDLPNLEVEKKIKKFKPDFILKNIDLVLACRTSLAEQAIAVGIKTLFYNPSTLNYPPKEIDPFYNYGIVADCDEIVIDMIDKITNKNKYIPDEKFEELRERYFNYKNNGKVCQSIRNHIKEML